jgi:hypothetical protein
VSLPDERKSTLSGKKPLAGIKFSSPLLLFKIAKYLQDLPFTV